MATWDDVRAIARELPESEETTSYRQPTFRVRGKLFAWLSPHERGALVLRCDIDERPLMIQSRPETYWVTPHYEGVAMVLVHLHGIERDELADRVTESWLLAAPKRLAAKLAT